jgi:hypothetical protein
MDTPPLKSAYGNVKMVVYFDIINLVRNYMVVNKLKIHMKNSHCKQFFNAHVKEIKIEIHFKMIMIWTY